MNLWICVRMFFFYIPSPKRIGLSNEFVCGNHFLMEIYQGKNKTKLNPKDFIEVQKKNHHKSRALSFSKHSCLCVFFSVKKLPCFFFPQKKSPAFSFGSLYLDLCTRGLKVEKVGK